MAEAFGKFSEGTRWEITKASIEVSNNAYVHTPKQLVVDLKGTIVKPIKTPSADWKLGRFAIPPNSLNDVNAITSNRCTDVIGLVKSVSETRTCHSGESVADIVLVDDSKSSEKNAAITFSCFGTQKDRTHENRRECSVGVLQPDDQGYSGRQA